MCNLMNKSFTNYDIVIDKISRGGFRVQRKVMTNLLLSLLSLLLMLLLPLVIGVW